MQMNGMRESEESTETLKDCYQQHSTAARRLSAETVMTACERIHRRDGRELLKRGRQLAEAQTAAATTGAEPVEKLIVAE